MIEHCMHKCCGYYVCDFVMERHIFASISNVLNTAPKHALFLENAHTGDIV